MNFKNIILVIVMSVAVATFSMNQEAILDGTYQIDDLENPDAVLRSLQTKITFTNTKVSFK